MSGLVDLGSLSSLSTLARYRKIIDWMKFTEKVPEVIDKEGADADSRSIDNCNVIQVVKLLVVNKGVGAEGVACFKLDNNRNGLICREFKNIYSVSNGCCCWLVNI